MIKIIEYTYKWYIHMVISNNCLVGLRNWLGPIMSLGYNNILFILFLFFIFIFIFIFILFLYLFYFILFYFIHF
jgi:hypothetical protein